jgi:hypothetical protein
MTDRHDFDLEATLRDVGARLSYPPAADGGSSDRSSPVDRSMSSSTTRRRGSSSAELGRYASTSPRTSRASASS